MIVYGKTKWEYKKGARQKVDAPQHEWIKVDAPHLRIVPESLWTAAQERLQGATRAYLRRYDGKLGGKPARGVLESKYLLSGHLQCGTCGGNMMISKKSGQRGRPVTMYICSTRRTRGTAEPTATGALTRPGPYDPPWRRGRGAAMDCIRNKVASGLLPSQPPRKSWAGFGSGQLCDACDEPIPASEIEHEVDFENYPPHRFHATCAAVWRVLVAQTTPAASEGA